MTERTLLEETKDSLERMQSFDVQSLVRTETLGTDLDFKEAVKPASKLVTLYKHLSISFLDFLPDKQLEEVKSLANGHYNQFKDIMNFSPTEDRSALKRRIYLDRLKDSYAITFDTLHPLISYGGVQSVDFQSVPTDINTLIQSTKNQFKESLDEIKEKDKEGEDILQGLRKTAEEQGVSQQAIYFKEEAEKHEKEAKGWKWVVIALGLTLVVLSGLSIFIHKIPYFSPENIAEGVQLIASKIIAFAAVGYMLVLSARNFLSHRHNVVVNKHRQNALVTFNALVDAAKEPENKEIILTHASACIFSPQDTGYIKDTSSNTQISGISAIDLIPRTLSRVDSSP